MRTEETERNHTEIPAASRSGADSTPGAPSALCESMNAHPRSRDACGTPTDAAYQPRGFEKTLVTSRVPNHPEDLTFKTWGVLNKLSHRPRQGRSFPVGEQEGFGSLTGQGGRANTGEWRWRQARRSQSWKDRRLPLHRGTVDTRLPRSQATRLERKAPLPRRLRPGRQEGSGSSPELGTAPQGGINEEKQHGSDSSETA